MTISDKNTLLIQKRVYDLLSLLGEESFDYGHIRSVEKNCVLLAKDRNLDINMARVIGLLHDVARYEGGFLGGNHSLVGSKRAKEWLESYDIDEEVIITVTKAIKAHSKKKNCR